MFYIWEVKFELKSDSVLAVQFFRFYRLQHITSGMRFDAFTTINRPYVLYTMHVWPAFSFLLFFSIFCSSSVRVAAGITMPVIAFVALYRSHHPAFSLRCAFDYQWSLACQWRGLSLGH